MNELIVPFALITMAHVVGDFLIQVPYHLNNKGDDWFNQINHVAVYALPLILLQTIIPFHSSWLPLNLLVHGITDVVTSSKMKFFWQTNKISKFYSTIAIDQLIHLITLLSTYVILM